MRNGKNLTQAEISEIKSVSSSENFMRLLEEGYENELKSLLGASSEDVLKHQGRCQILKEILGYFSEYRKKY